MEISKIRESGFEYAIVDRKGRIIEGSIDSNEYIDIFNSLSYFFELGGDELKEMKINSEKILVLIKLDEERVVILKANKSQSENIEKLIEEIK